ncbi:properdin-like [Aulostomus maculatus]
MRLLQVLLVLLVSVTRSECVKCYESFNQTSGHCGKEIGEVDEDNCCQNPHYGYQATDGVCQSCGPPAWSPWSAWSPCNVLCGEGVRQKSRKCFGVNRNECENPEDKLQWEPCTGTCCDAHVWGSWLPWSSCSVTCGNGGARKRQRVCSGPPECHSDCSGASVETEKCSAHTCSVHGGWSSWSDWSLCSGSCINDQLHAVTIPSKQRHRSCSNPAPSNDTVPPGNGCQGDAKQVQPCSELPNCPVNGNWGAWSPFGPCSSSCGKGLKLSTRMCDRPAPKYGGQVCDGLSTRSNACQTVCPVDGFWSGWSSWGECSSSCIPGAQVPVRTRHRSCNNPAPSSSPPGAGCPGDSRGTENCSHLPHCPVDGGLGSWSAWSACPVTCGVGVQQSVRNCDSPAPKYGGRQCSGELRKTKVCTTHVHCPVDGVWSEWSPWQPCTYPFSGRNIRCTQTGGKQLRNRTCLHQDHNGSICPGINLIEFRACYDVSGCYFKGSWEGWESWSSCTPSCGDNSKRIRRRKCSPDYSNYNPVTSRLKKKAAFHGTPITDCGDLPPRDQKFQVQPCVNMPACP